MQTKIAMASDNINSSIPSILRALERDIETTEAIKAQMSEKLARLEASATGKTLPKTGGWRHDPRAWAKANLN
jgi:hypothetical protein